MLSCNVKPLIIKFLNSMDFNMDNNMSVQGSKSYQWSDDFHKSHDAVSDTFHNTTVLQKGEKFIIHKNKNLTVLKVFLPVYL